MNNKKAQKKYGSKHRFMFERGTPYPNHTSIVDCTRNLEMVIPSKWRKGIEEFVKYFNLDEMPKKGIEGARQ